MIIIHHNKDMDGYCSGAVCKLKYPHSTLIGWDYKDTVPDFEQFTGEEIIMIDITFPFSKMIELGKICNLTLIDHHLSFKKQVDNFNDKNSLGVGFNYIYEDGIAACEIGWNYLFSEVTIPYAVQLIGRYDTWRKNEGDWENATLPFKYFMYSICNSTKNFPSLFFYYTPLMLDKKIILGKSIMKYQETMDEAATQRSSFEREVYEGLKGICINTRFFSSETLKSIYDPTKHDIMIGFEYIGDGKNHKWSVSLRSDKLEINVSEIAKRKGGGGHKNAAGYECYSLEQVFK